MANYSQAELQYIASQVHPYLLELVRSNGLDVDSIEVVNDTDGITSLPAYDNRGGTKKVVRVPLSTFSKPAQDAADQLAENIASAGEAAAKANEAATKANAAADEINAVKEDIIQAVEDAQKAVQDSQAALTEVSEKIVEINSSETSRQEAEQSRQNAESARATEYSSLKNQMESSISEMDVATESALDTANHPTYIGEDNYVYIWNKSNQRYDKTNIYVKGDEGEPGTDGQDPVLTFGTITTLNPGESASATLVSKGVDASGRPVYQLNLSIPRGDKGENGSGSGNVLVSTAGLQSGKTYLFKPNQNASAEGTFVEYEMSQIDTSTLATKTELSQGLAAKQDTINDLETIRSGASKGTTAVQPSELASVAKSGSYNDLTNKPAIPSAVTESTVSGWGFTKNTGTYSKPSGGIPKRDLASAVQTSLGKADTALQSYTEKYKGTVTGVKMNGSTKNPSNGVVDLGSVITSHQDISGKQDKLISGTNIKTINGQSLLGSGNIDACSYPVVNHGTNDTTFTLTPNTYHIWGEVTSLNLSLGAEVSGVVNEYVFQYSVGDSAPTLTFPETIAWVNPPTGNKVNTTYIVSIVNNIGLIVRT